MVISTPPPPSRRFVAAFGVLACTLALGIVTSCGDDRSADQTAPLAPTSTEIQGLVRDDPINVADQSLPEVTGDGATTPFTFRAEAGELLVVAFGYTNCPDVCPTTWFDLKKALSEIGDDADRVHAAFATVDPDRDTAEIMPEYLGSFVDDGHPLRTEDPEVLEAVEQAFGVTSSVEQTPEGRIEVAHSAKSFVVDDRGDIVVEWSFGTPYAAMASDLQILLDQRA